MCPTMVFSAGFSARTEGEERHRVLAGIAGTLSVTPLLMGHGGSWQRITKASVLFHRLISAGVSWGFGPVFPAKHTDT